MSKKKKVVKKRKRKKSKKNSSKLLLSSIFKICIFLFLIFVISIFGLYLYVDNKVVKEFLETKISRGGNILTAERKLYSDSGLTLNKFIDILKRRNYRENLVKNIKPGEYFKNKDSVIFKVLSFDNPTKAEKTFIFTNSNFYNSNFKKIGQVNLSSTTLETNATSAQRLDDFVSLDKIPKSVTKAIILTEDKRFFDHLGIDFKGIFRALFENIIAGRVVQGGSTITQQLAKNTLLYPKRTIKRKVLEIFAAISLERRLSKFKILERYLNEVYLGQKGNYAIHGVGLASKYFFQKPLKDLNLSESAMLAGLIKAPSYYSPVRHLDRATQRRNEVLNIMLSSKAISNKELKKAKSHSLSIKASKLQKQSAPFFNIQLRKKLREFDSLERLDVHTTLDLELQICADNAINTALKVLEKTHANIKANTLQAGLISIEPHSGYIRAWSGGRDYSKNQFDHVLSAKRQIGSTVKPFVYLTALDKSLNNYKAATPTTIVRDAPFEVRVPSQDPWRPENFDKEYRGDVTIRYALEKSLNVPAAYLGQKVGIKNIAKVLEKFRIGEKIPEVPSLVLGALDTNLLQLTSAYSTLANSGIYLKPKLFQKITDSKSRVIFDSGFQEEKIVNDGEIYVLTNMLQGVLERGTGKIIRNSKITRPLAGKTGTSNEMRDSWFITYSPNLATGVWLGRDDNSPTGLTGGGGAGKVMVEYLKCINPYIPKADFVKPKNVEIVEIDYKTGSLASSNCPPENVISEVFVANSQPNDICRAHDFIDPNKAKVSKKKRIPRQENIQKPKQRKRSFWNRLFGG